GREVAPRVAAQPGHVLGAVSAHHRQAGGAECTARFTSVARELERGPELKVSHGHVGVQVRRLSKCADSRSNVTAGGRTSAFRHQALKVARREEVSSITV